MARLLILFEYPVLNGAEHSLLAMLGEVLRSEFRPVALAPEGPLATQLREICPLIPAGRLYEPGLAQSYRREALAEIVQRVSPRLLHANSVSMSRLAGPVAAESTCRAIGHLRDIFRLSPRAVEDVNRMRRLLAVSNATRAWHVAQGVTAETTHVLYNGVDIDRFRPNAQARQNDSLRRQLEIPAEATLIVGIGQLGMRKGWDVWLRAFELVVDALPNVHFVLIGERNSQKHEAIEYERQLYRHAEHPSLRGLVHIIGRRDDIPDVLAQADLLVHPARQEPLGRVLLEGAAAGIPIVATDVGGTREIFPSHHDGAVVIPPSEPLLMADAVRELLQSPVARKNLGTKGRRRIVDCFDARVAARNLLAHYRDTLMC